VEQFQRWGVLENPHPQGLGDPRLAQHQIQWVQVPGPHVHQAAGIDLRADDLVHILRTHHTDLMVVALRQ